MGFRINNMDKKTFDFRRLYLKYKERLLASLAFVIFIFGLVVMLGAGSDEKIIKPQSELEDGGGSKNTSSAKSSGSDSGEIQDYDFREAIDHIGEKVRITGEVLRVFTAKSGVTFLDFCEDFSDCPFSAVIFASDAKKFPDVTEYEREVTITGTIKSYNGKAEIILKSPEQIE
jgi:DNA/RNA endonuclease YhcR with UshA esterase domain